MRIRNSGYYSYVETNESYLDASSRATYKGIAVKTILLLALVIIIAAGTAIGLPYLLTYYEGTFYVTLIVSIIIGFIAALAGRLSVRLALPCSIIYSICEGLFVGTITALVNYYYASAGTLAVAATLSVFTIMLVLYSFGFIRNFGVLRMILFGILFAVLTLVAFDLIYILLFNHESNTLYFMIQAALLIYGVITLAFNFAEAEAVVKLGAPKEAEWSVALGIEISLIYIYIYFLRIIASFANRR